MVERLLQSRSEAVGLPLELLSGRGGLDRPIASPHIQKTGLALAGFHEYLRPARVLVFATPPQSHAGRRYVVHSAPRCASQRREVRSCVHAFSCASSQEMHVGRTRMTRTGCGFARAAPRYTHCS